MKYLQFLVRMFRPKPPASPIFPLPPGATLWLVVTEWDSDPDPIRAIEYGPAQGPIIHEGLLTDRESAFKRAENLAASGFNYGWAAVIRVRVDPQNITYFLRKEK